MAHLPSGVIVAIVFGIVMFLLTCLGLAIAILGLCLVFDGPKEWVRAKWNDARSYFGRGEGSFFLFQMSQSSLNGAILLFSGKHGAVFRVHHLARAVPAVNR